jgi:hypothetical protein
MRASNESGGGCLFDSRAIAVSGFLTHLRMQRPKINDEWLASFGESLQGFSVQSSGKKRSGLTPDPDPP